MQCHATAVTAVAWPIAVMMCDLLRLCSAGCQSRGVTHQGEARHAEMLVHMAAFLFANKKHVHSVHIAQLPSASMPAKRSQNQP